MAKKFKTTIAKWRKLGNWISVVTVTKAEIETKVFVKCIQIVDSRSNIFIFLLTIMHYTLYV